MHQQPARSAQPSNTKPRQAQAGGSGDVSQDHSKSSEAASDPSNRQQSENAALASFANILHMVLSAGGPVLRGDLNAREPETGRTPLMLACATANFVLVRRMMEVANEWWASVSDKTQASPFDLQLACANGKTALDYAVAAKKGAEAAGKRGVGVDRWEQNETDFAWCCEQLQPLPAPEP